MAKSKGEVTSPRVARIASKALSNPRTSNAGKSTAGSALTQKPSKRGK